MSVDSKEKLEQIPSAHGSLSSAEHALIDEKEIEKRVWRKLDFYVVPIVTMYYLLSFLVCVPIEFALLNHSLLR